MPGFRSFFRFLHHFVLAKLASSKRVNSFEIDRKVISYYIFVWEMHTFLNITCQLEIC